MKVFKYIFLILMSVAIAAGMCFLFFHFTLPAINQDRWQMVEQERELHNQTLEAIKKDFSYVLSADNVTVNVNQNINITISGEVCDLKVKLDRNLKMLSLETVDKTENDLVGPSFASAGECIGLVGAIVWLGYIIGDIVKDIKISFDIRKSRKKDKSNQVDVDVLV